MSTGYILSNLTIVIWITPTCPTSMKLGFHTPVSYSIDLKFEHQSSACYPHVQGEVEVVELHAFSGGKSCKQALWHRVEVSGERANIDQSFPERIRRGFRIACNKVVLDNERLARAKVARVVERYRGRFGDLGALVKLSASIAEYTQGVLPSQYATAFDRLPSISPIMGSNIDRKSDAWPHQRQWHSLCHSAIDFVG